MNIFIGNLDYAVKESEIMEQFEKFGTVNSVKIITDKVSGRSKGFGFVEMPDDAQAQAAIAGLNGQPVRSRNLAVSEARPKA
jgi:RNA recognition motif-containing protein